MKKLKNHHTLVANERDSADRISLSIPRKLLKRFNQLVDERGFDNRSQAVSELMSRELDRHRANTGNDIMTGTITLVYEHARMDLKKRLAVIQSEHIKEVISSLHVLLENQHTLEVVLVQGRAHILQKIADEFITCKGVKTGTMTLSAALMPPLQHPTEKIDQTQR